ncbi:DUF4349 domain-containing protein [Pseudonocardia dioxanivorans]|uniref:DUF4349 domain-containing protein n=1 Tax=Pseudonocardia dioxanivorans TaxID=240495 RepID=UPI000D0392F8|nr:DUF4349 domain-containing protein [Pseudonocardia dioxanivorans]
MTTTETPVPQAPPVRTPPPPPTAPPPPAAPSSRGRAGRRTAFRVAGVVLAALVLGVLLAAMIVATTSSGASGERGSSAGYAAPATGGASEGSVAPAAPSESSDSGARAVAPGADPAQTAIGPDRAVVRSATVRVEVADPAVAAADVRAAASSAGGYAANERSASGRSDLVVKVPSAGLDAFLNRIGGLGTVTDRSTTARDVTDQLVDTDARVASMRASVDRVRALLAQADSVSEIVSIESELTRRQADLDALERRLAALRTSTDLATIDVALVPRGTAPAADPGPGFGAGLGTGWEWLRGIGSALAATVGFLLPLLPVVAVLVLLGWGGRRVLRSRRVRAGGPDAGPAPAAGGPAGSDTETG